MSAKSREKFSKGTPRQTTDLNFGMLLPLQIVSATLGLVQILRSSSYKV